MSSPLERDLVKSSLKLKGFVEVQSDHTRYFYWSKDGKKSSVRTHVSHGSSHKEIGNQLIGPMARQCHLTTSQFRDLINCPLSRDEYENILISKGLIEKPAQSQ